MEKIFDVEKEAALRKEKAEREKAKQRSPKSQVKAIKYQVDDIVVTDADVKLRSSAKRMESDKASSSHKQIMRKR